MISVETREQGKYNNGDPSMRSVLAGRVAVRQAFPMQTRDAFSLHGAPCIYRCKIRYIS